MQKADIFKKLTLKSGQSLRVNSISFAAKQDDVKHIQKRDYFYLAL